MNLEEKLEGSLREAACYGDAEAILALLAQNVDVNSKNPINGWTALHWACKRNHEEVVRLLLKNGADKSIQNLKSETPVDVCTSTSILNLLGANTETLNRKEEYRINDNQFTPNYIKTASIPQEIDIGKLRPHTHSELKTMQTTSLPATQDNEIVLKVKVRNGDPDFIEIEIPKWKLTYNYLVKVCCEELGIAETDLERIRKLPDTRLRKDSDVKRLKDFTSLELVLKSQSSTEKANNCYQSISTCKDQTILY